ncbi:MULTISPECIES: hypothetical protein [unclassified Janthinobacterium]|uniref:hypothetical protein n=1 Tax=unclassified Janthinobacterium TaxID=2610881 RepID=UPI0025B56DA0|nr:MULTISPECIES: hypothetical protein [unclassified Janthinobacterium]MDN2700720.1 hypothetical protein [Janthinobacterium sp. SUN100]MDN2714240.1 hypothetical protein [Janthinobacterium sp. SUN120]
MSDRELTIRMQFLNPRIKEFIIVCVILTSCATSVFAQEPGRMAQVAKESSGAESWLHIYRDVSPMIVPADKGPYDEYLNLDHVEVKGEWVLVHIKTIRDGPSTEYHGKLILSTLAIACERVKFGHPYIAGFHDVEGRMPMHETTLTFAELDRLASGRIPAANSPSAIYYRFACLGLKPRPEEVGWTGS